MSEPTKVKGSAHTPGPLTVSSTFLVCNKEAKIVAHFQPINGMPVDLSPSFAEAAANARRIVACINYCEGVSTAEIEQAPSDMNLRRLLHFIDNDVPLETAQFAKVQADRNHLRERVAELTNALSVAIAWINTQILTANDVTEHDSNVLRQARAILAKVRP